jgi:hypothetical protein
MISLGIGFGGSYLPEVRLRSANISGFSVLSTVGTPDERVSP